MPIENNKKQIEHIEKVIQSLEKIKEQVMDGTSYLKCCDFTITDSIPDFMGDSDHRIDLTIEFIDSGMPPYLEK
ncbi:hypothetical protein ACFFH2_01290 [Enterococcus devriesei]|uniref:hypothetical protein n=1 Tax=Enterococcus devriesei TaxID=319970 RepID=UPI0009004402|nr:hypothetical protein [Enterococcus devriesei]